MKTTEAKEVITAMVEKARNESRNLSHEGTTFFLWTDGQSWKTARDRNQPRKSSAAGAVATLVECANAGEINVETM